MSITQTTPCRPTWRAKPPDRPPPRGRRVNSPAIPREFVERIQQFAASDEVELILDALIEKYQASWRTSAPENPAQREHLYRMVLAVEGLKNEIRNVAQDDIITAHNKGLQRASNW